jgi:Ca2+-binding EF-hand superfamily protein
MMTRRRVIVGSMAAGLILGGVVPALAAAKRSRAIQLLDPDNDGMVDLDKVKTAAAALFDRLDRNRNGFLNKRELGGRVIPQEFAAVDSDRDGTLSKNEYLMVVEKRFKAADPDNSGRVHETKLNSRAGRPLLRLLVL